MLKYLIVQLDDTSVSFCHYNNDKDKPNLIELDVLKKAIFWSMKENLTVQFLYPDYQLPADYKDAISEIDHADIVSSTCEDKKLLESSDVVVFDNWDTLNKFQLSQDQAYVVRTSFADLFSKGALLSEILPKLSRLNVIITDVESFTSDTEKRYSEFLNNLSEEVYKEYRNNHAVQVNILTDRILLDTMNNCGAGVETITLAPDGMFYICPGFYIDRANPVGNPQTGLLIPNSQLYNLDHAPICRICDAWHCKRCIWQNKRSTLEVNTPSREQCVIAHVERNASKQLLNKIRTIGDFLPEKVISELDYMDPFEKIIKNY